MGDGSIRPSLTSTSQDGLHIAFDFVLNPNTSPTDMNGRGERQDWVLDEFIEK